MDTRTKNISMDGILELEAEAYDAPGYTLKYCFPVKI